MAQQLSNSFCTMVTVSLNVRTIVVLSSVNKKVYVYAR